MCDRSSDRVPERFRRSAARAGGERPSAHGQALARAVLALALGCTSATGGCTFDDGWPSRESDGAAPTTDAGRDDSTSDAAVAADQGMAGDGSAEHDLGSPLDARGDQDLHSGPLDGATGRDAAESDTGVGPPHDVGGADAGRHADGGALLDAGPPPDAGVDAGGPLECDPGDPGCTCVVDPRDPDLACWHSFGGHFGEGACSPTYQCCGGAWRRGNAVCGPCTCEDGTGRLGCVPLDQGAQTCFPAFDGSAGPLPAEVRADMTDSSWRQGCPVGLDSLALLELPYWDFEGRRQRGELVVAADAAQDVLDVFAAIYRARFPLERLERVDAYGADDDLSMAANNTSAFNCRQITGGGAWSEHSYGTAIDINPVQNPYVRGGLVLPPSGAGYVERAPARPGMVLDPGPVRGAFRAIGWGWGGDWASPTDYQHFSASGR